MTDLEQSLGTFIREMSRDGTIETTEIHARLPVDLRARLGHKLFLKSLLTVSGKYQARGQAGRACTSLVVGTALLGDRFLIQAERARLLLSDGMPGFGRFLSTLDLMLCETEDHSIRLLKARLRTYIVYHQLAVTLRTKGTAAKALLAKQPRHALKGFLALINVYFLRERLGIDFGDQYAEFLTELGHPEETASIASILVASANESQVLNGLDFAFPLDENILNEDVAIVSQYGRDKHLQHEIGKLITLFGYRLKVVRANEPVVFHLEPPSHSFEYHLRLGFVREGLAGRVLPRSRMSRDVPEVSLFGLARLFAEGSREKISEIVGRGTRAPRVRVHLPVMPEELRDAVAGAFYEDAILFDRLAQQFLIPLRNADGEDIVLTEHLTLHQFWRLWKLLQFATLIQISVLEHYAKAEPRLIPNSLVSVSNVDRLVEFLRENESSEQQVTEFLNLISASVENLGYYDLQYRPFLRISSTAKVGGRYIKSPGEMVSLSGLVASSNILPNVQHANKLRLKANAGIFVDIVAKMFNSRFSRVTSNRRLQNKQRSTDADVVVLENSTLYLFECKYSVPPNDPHELREAWESIERAAYQLSQAIEILSDSQKCQDYIAGWFPGTEAAPVRIQPCILSSHRMFSGMEYNEIPVRDYSSLSRLFEDGVVSIGTAEPSGKITMHRYRIVSEGGFSIDDLDSYLSLTSKSFAIHRPFMREVTSIQPFANGSAVIAADSYLYEIDCNEEWFDVLDGLGLTRLPDEERQIDLPLSVEQLKDRLLQKQGGLED